MTWLIVAPVPVQLGSVFGRAELSPHADLAQAKGLVVVFANDWLPHSQRDELVVNCTIDPRLDAKSDQKIGCWFAGENVVRDADRIFRARGHHLIDIGAEGQHLLAPFAHPVELHCDERRILHVDAAPFGGRFKIK